MILQMIETFLVSQVGQTLTKDTVNGLLLLINATITHHMQGAGLAPDTVVEPHV